MKTKLALSFVFSLVLVAPFLACTDSVKAATYKQSYSVKKDINNSLNIINSHSELGNKTQIIAAINMEPLVIVVKRPAPTPTPSPAPTPKPCPK